MRSFGIVMDNTFGGPSYCEHSRAWLEREIEEMGETPKIETERSGGRNLSTLNEALARQWCALRGYGFVRCYDADRERRLMRGILDCYAGLSPENLSVDGSLSIASTRNEERVLHARLARLQVDLGYSVSEACAIEWEARRLERKKG